MTVIAVGELSVLRCPGLGTDAPPARRGRWSSRVQQACGGGMTPPQKSVQPPPKDEGTVRRSGSSTLITRPADRTFKQKMTCTNEATRLVYEPGFAGHKSEVMMSPASCFAWRGFSLPATGSAQHRYRTPPNIAQQILRDSSTNSAPSASPNSPRVPRRAAFHKSTQRNVPAEDTAGAQYISPLRLTSLLTLRRGTPSRPHTPSSSRPRYTRRSPPA